MSAPSFLLTGTLRPVTPADLGALAAWLPAQADAQLPTDPEAEHWLLLEGRPHPDAAAQALACLRLRPAIGLRTPRHWYHRGCVVQAAPSLGLFHQLHTLLLGNDLTGAAELADIAWDRRLPEPAQAQTLRQLLRASLDALSTLPGATGAVPGSRHIRLMVELPGVRDSAGRSPFWQGLGRHFYPADLPAGASPSRAHWRSQVATLLPRQPVHVCFLPPEAQAAIGQPDPSWLKLAQVLCELGLHPGQHVCIDDAGPVHEGWLHFSPTPGA